MKRRTKKPISNSSDNTELDALKERYSLLKNLRETEPERILKAHKAHAEEKERAQNDLINHWRSIAENKGNEDKKKSKGESMEKVDHYKKEIATLKESVHSLQSQFDEKCRQNEQLERTNKQLKSTTTVAVTSDFTREELMDARNIISLYEKLTCLSVQPSDEGEDTFTCIAISKADKQAVKFSLTCQEGEEIEFRPYGNSSILPPFLQNAISFEVNQAPLFFSKVATSLHRE